MQINLDKTKTYLLACSYGPDSMVLFDLLLKGGYSFKVAHVNYMLRGLESSRETASLQEYAQVHNTALFTKFVDGSKVTGNFQKVARDIRYNFFKEIMAKEGLDILLTAHHLDDHLETYLMQKTSKRKSFYYGIKEEVMIEDVYIKRPLLRYEKDDIFNYAKSENVPYGIDSSNLTLKYTRNKMRLNILKNMDFAAKRALIDEINTLNADAQKTENELKTFLINNTIAINHLLTLEEEKREHLVYLMFRNVGISNKYSKAKSNNVNIVAKNTTESLMYRIYKDVFLVKYEGKIRLFNINDFQSYSFIINEPRTIKTAHFIAYFDKKGVKPPIDKEAYPLEITTYKKGDTYQIKDYDKAVNRLFIDMKLPRHYRLVWPLVRNNKGKIIYIPRYRANYVAKTTDLFKIFVN